GRADTARGLLHAVGLAARERPSGLSVAEPHGVRGHGRPQRQFGADRPLQRGMTMSVNEPHVIIAGGGIGGLATALTLHQIGVPFTVYEAVRELAPLGVGINIQPNAVRELNDLGIGRDLLDRVGLPAREWALVGLNGNGSYSEPRGLEAGYKWPQYAVHRGRLHMMLYRTLVERAGADVVKQGHKVTGYERNDDGTVAALIQ